MLATGCYDNTARIWDTASGSKFLDLPHPDSVGEVAFSPDGRMLATAADTARIWDTATGDQLLDTESGWLDSLTLSHDGRLLAIVGTGRLRLWRLE
jgi:WD40 repeat protein